MEEVLFRRFAVPYIQRTKFVFVTILNIQTMKKYFFGGLCTSSTSGKGMCVAVFILLISVSGFSQSWISKNDSSSVVFKKWEVSLDLKPVFRADQPFKIFIAKNLTERSAIRFGH